MSDPITFMASLSCNGGTREPAPPPVEGETDACGNVTYPPPIPNCEHLNAVDGCCGHPDAMTPECHPWADCPPLQEQIARLREQLADADKTLAGFTRAVREARECIVAIRDMADSIDAMPSTAAFAIRETCDRWLSPPLAAVPAARVLTEGKP